MKVGTIMAFMQVDYYSQNLMRSISCAIIIPSDKTYLKREDKPNIEPPFKTLYLLHGVMDNYLSWNSHTSIQRLANLYNIVVVMPSGDNKFYADSATIGDSYASLVGEELIEFTRNTFNLSRRREDTYIGGYSLGGYGAIMAGFRYPGTFSKVISLSGWFPNEMILDMENNDNKVLFFNKKNIEAIYSVSDYRNILNTDNDHDYLAKKLVENKDVLPEIYLRVGTEDFLYESNVSYYNLLKELGYSVTWISKSGDHDWQFWDESIEDCFKWLGLDVSDKFVPGGKLVL